MKKQVKNTSKNDVKKSVTVATAAVVSENANSHKIAVAVAGGAATVAGGGGSSAVPAWLDRFNAAASMESETTLQAKEDTLYNKILRKFSVTPFDSDAATAAYISEAVTAGVAVTPAFLQFVSSEVKKQKDEYNATHQAPACSVSSVIDTIKNDYRKEWRELTQCDINGVTVDDIRIYSRQYGFLRCEPLNVNSDTTPAQIIRAVLSYRHKILDDIMTMRENVRRRSNYWSGLRTAARQALNLGYDKETIINDFSAVLRNILTKDTDDLVRLRKNLIKQRNELLAVSSEVLNLCPSCGFWWCGTPVLNENITKDERARVGRQFSRVRAIRRNITALNAALFVVDNIQ